MAFVMTGASELIKKLHALPEKVARKHLRKATLAAAEPIRERMASLAPRGDPAAPTLADIAVMSVRGDIGLSASVVIGPTKDAYYGYFQEFGTKHHAAQPFARPAFDSENDAAQQELADQIWAAFVAEAGR